MQIYNSLGDMAERGMNPNSPDATTGEDPVLVAPTEDSFLSLPAVSQGLSS